jgi:hypothetical protein
MSWKSAGHPKCNHKGEAGAYCQMCGFPLHKYEVSLEFIEVIV